MDAETLHDASSTLQPDEEQGATETVVGSSSDSSTPVSCSARGTVAIAVNQAQIDESGKDLGEGRLP